MGDRHAPRKNRMPKERKKWQTRPLDEVYPVAFVDATYFYVKDNGVSGKKTVYIILEINSDGYKDVLHI